MDHLLEVNSVSFHYQTPHMQITVFEDLQLFVEKEEFLTIIGPSGCGKSTLLNILCGLLQPDSGTVCLNGRPLSERTGAIGYMFQKDQLFEWRTLYKNVVLGPEISGTLTPQKKKEAVDLLYDYDLTEFYGSKPSELSGGMRQRAALIRTLMNQPKLLLLDEPFSALDYQTRLQVCDDIWRIIKRQKKTAVMVTHDLAEAISTADRILILSRRPSKVQRVLSITFDKKDASPLERRSEKEFNSYFHEIWEVLQE